MRQSKAAAEVGRSYPVVRESPNRRMAPGFMQQTVVTVTPKTWLIPIKRTFLERDLAAANEKGKGSGKETEK